MEAQKIKSINHKALFVIGETVTPQDRENAREWFGCDLHDCYGLRENVASASECEHFNMHINSEFTYVEFERDGRPAEAGELADIVGTNHYNYATPVIRYLTEDKGRQIESKCPCGRELPLMRIEGGRSRDYITTKKGQVFVTWHIVELIDEKMGVKALQLYQPDIDNVIVRIAKRDDFGEAAEAKILEVLRKITQNEVHFKVEYLPEIERTELGKYIFVKSDV